MNVSKTGRPCKSWIKHSSVYKFTHNYCRNFGGENYSPWCFVANGEKEFCNIPKCEKQTTGKAAFFDESFSSHPRDCMHGYVCMYVSLYRYVCVRMAT